MRLIMRQSMKASLQTAQVLRSRQSLQVMPFHSRTAIASAQGKNATASPKPDIKQLARMAQIAITDQEVKDMEPKINSILNWFDQLQSVDTAGVAPAIHASEQGTAVRRDEPVVYTSRSELLSQAPALDQAYFKVPKIATGADAPTPVVSATASASLSSPATAASTPATSAASSTSSTDGSSPPSGPEQAALQILDFRVGKIVACEKHPEADSLYVEKIDIGEAEPRTIVSGLVKYVPLEEMQNRMVVIIANLKPRNMRGIKSAGMVLAASDEGKTVVMPIIPPPGAVVGERLYFGLNKEQPAPAAPNAVEKKKLWEVAAPGLRTNAEGVATWQGAPMMTGAGPVTAPGLTNARVA